MDGFVFKGAAQACVVLNQIGATQWYEAMCVGYKNSDAYYQVGLIFWACVALAVGATLAALRKSLAYAFG